MSTDLHVTQGFGRVTGFGRRPALLVIDFQRGLSEAEAPLGGPQISQAVEATVPVMQAADHLGIPIYLTATFYRKDAVDAGIFARKVRTAEVLIEGTPWAELDLRLPVKENHVIVEKKMPSAYFGTPLPMMLASTGADTVIVTGCTTSGCVRATAVDAMSYGYRVIVPRQCVGDRETNAHEANLIDIDRKCGDVVDVDHVFDNLKPWPR